MLRSNTSPRSYRGGGTLAALLDANLRIMTFTSTRRAIGFFWLSSSEALRTERTDRRRRSNATRPYTHRARAEEIAAVSPENLIPDDARVGVW
jgi:hypothetical protein